MAIKNGSVADADEVNSVILKSGIMAQANIQKFSNSIYNANDGDYLGDGQDYLVDGFAIEGLQDKSNSSCVISNEFENTSTRNYNAQNMVYGAHVLDNFNDSSIDAGIWTTAVTGNGAVAENTQYIQLSTAGGGNGTASLISDGASGFDARTFSGDSEIIMHIYEQDQDNTNRGILQISNGSTNVTLKDLYTGTTALSDIGFLIRIKIDKSAEEAFVSVNGGAFGGAIDISSVTTNWYIRVQVDDTGSKAITTRIYFIGYIDGTSGTVDYVSATKTFGATKDAGVLTWDYNGTDSDIAGYLSADSGSNYTSVVKDTWTTIGTSGTGGKIKLTITVPTSIDATTSTSDITNLKIVGAYFD